MRMMINGLVDNVHKRYACNERRPPLILQLISEGESAYLFNCLFTATVSCFVGHRRKYYTFY